jgi:hypothetical protein
LMTTATSVGCSTGISAGLAPFRICNYPPAPDVLAEMA